MRLDVDGRTLELIQGDITTVRADAVVNAANAQLAGGGGVDGAIHRAGGPAIMAECRRIGGCPTGDAAATTAGNLPARHVIHAVAPRWSGGTRGEAGLLASAYRSGLRIAGELGATSIAFPSLGTGAYGYPIELAAPIALGVVLEHLRGPTSIHQVTFVLFSQQDLETYARALTRLQRSGATSSPGASLPGGAKNGTAG